MAGKKLTKKPQRTRRNLDAREKLFVGEYLVTLNPEKAALAAGYSKSVARTKAYLWVSSSKHKPHVFEAIAVAQQKRAERTEITQDKVLERYWQIATANANELVQFRRVCCRYCHGKGFLYQWRNEREFQDAVAAAKAQGESATVPVDDGGYGYDRRLRPNPKCPECYGEGIGEIFAADTRDVPAGALVLYAGVKQTQGGFEVKTHDQLAALQSVARHLGMFNDKVKVNLDGSVTVNHELPAEALDILRDLGAIPDGTA